MEFMNAVLQLQPADETTNVIPFDPARRSRLCAVADARMAQQRPVRARSLAIALAVGALIGALISLSAVGTGSSDLTGDQIKTEAVAPDPSEEPARYCTRISGGTGLDLRKSSGISQGLRSRVR